MGLKSSPQLQCALVVPSRPSAVQGAVQLVPLCGGTLGQLPALDPPLFVRPPVLAAPVPPEPPDEEPGFWTEPPQETTKARPAPIDPRNVYLAITPLRVIGIFKRNTSPMPAI
jgi:hypothetical protein